ncbi:hypothetical protein [Amorphus orientalis]|uniref:Uncharacterized protein n=1 Tax=Amorphus orientalis TaxID=649198 RepID=A0AAE3VSW3_9HYPH|nr:hypothetical protein [Amorphus orientalis]MDQ0317358.1 hypothetical protein [Amorphus orientalis]
MLALAGGAGEDARAGWRYRAPDTEVVDFVARTFNFQGGGCDGCSAAYGAWQVVSPRAENAAPAAAVWRAGEDAAAALLALPNVRAAVADLAVALMQDHRIDGERAHEVINKHIEFGGLIGAVEERAQCLES